jgi:hypothetical protein
MANSQIRYRLIVGIGIGATIILEIFGVRDITQKQKAQEAAHSAAPRLNYSNLVC